MPSTPAPLATPPRGPARRLLPLALAGALLFVANAAGAGEPAPPPDTTPAGEAEDGGEAAATGEATTVDRLLDWYGEVTRDPVDKSKAVREWVQGDLKRAAAWEYRVVRVNEGLAADAEALEKKMNALGEKRWELAAALPGPGGGLLLFKRRQVSLLKKLPVGDLLRATQLFRFAPGGTDGDGSGQ